MLSSLSSSLVFFFRRKTAYELLIRDWSSDVCSSDLFHLAVKALGRSAGRSATAAAAYRAGVEITDERTGLVHDYTRKQGVEHSELMLPTDAPEWAADRERLWNAAELAETRKNATVARE